MPTPDGTLIGSLDADPVYFAFQGRRHHVPDPATFTYLGYEPADVSIVSREELETLVLGLALPSLASQGERRFQRALEAQIEASPEQLPRTTSEATQGYTWAIALLAIVLASALSVGVPYIAPYSTGLTPDQYEIAVAALRASLIQVFAGAGIVIGVVFTWQANRLSRQSLGASNFVQMSERYTASLELISAESQTQRIGGFLSLARIAQVSRGDRRSVAELCTARLLDPPMSGVERRVIAFCLAEVRVAGYKGMYLLRNVSIEDTTFSELDLSYSNLTDSTLTSVSALHSDWKDAMLIKSTWRQFDIRYSELQRLIVRSSILDGDMSWSNLEGCVFMHSSLERVSFVASKLTGCIFVACDLRRANFCATDLSDVRFFMCDLRQAAANSATRWPKGFDPILEQVSTHD